MRIHLDPPTYDCTEGAAHKLRPIKNDARRPQLEIEQMERHAGGQSREDRRLSLFREPTINERPRGKDAPRSDEAPDGGSDHWSGGGTFAPRPRRGDRSSLGQASRPSEICDPPSRPSLGRAARPSEIRDPPSREEGLEIAQLRVGDGAWVRRSGGGWTYAVVKERGNASLKFTVNKRGSTKTCPLDGWHKYVRAVKNVSNEASPEKDGHANRPAGKKAEKDKSPLDRSLVLREWDSMDGSDYGHDHWDESSPPFSSSWSMESTEDSGRDPA